MDAKKIVKSIIQTVITIAVLMVLVKLIYSGMNQAYDYGYRIFADEPITPPPGEDKYVGIVEGNSVLEIGEKLEENNLIRSARLFYFQEMLSPYHGKLQSGAYVLNTEMTPYEIMAVMASGYTEEEDVEMESGSSTESSEEDGEYTGSEELGEDSGDTGVVEDAPSEETESSEE